MTTLVKSLGAARGTALMLNIVIGAGLLVLPGLAVQEAGDLAIWSWIACAIAALPLLGVFLLLGRRFPDAGGVAHLARQGFGPAGYAVASFLLLGAVIFGLPSIALTGGYYAKSILGGDAHLYAALLIVLGAAIHLVSSTGAAKFNSVVAASVVVALVILLSIGFFGLPAASRSPALATPGLGDLDTIFAPFMMIFFAFTGWEVGAGISEEFRNPRRDLPIAMFLSFAIAVSLYAAAAFLSQRVELAGNFTSPFVAMVEPTLGRLGSVLVSVTAVIIVFANLSGAIWGVSRLVFALSREGMLPSTFQTARDGSPVQAVAFTAAALLCVVTLDAAGILGIGRMLSMAGQNFLILYGIAAATLLLTAQGWSERLLAGVSVVIVLGLLVKSGQSLAYPAAIAACAMALTGSWRARHAGLARPNPLKPAKP
ncbi:amino acid/polyamine/organocation transporter, APC superfamily [Rhizobiales bacterium GAS113]|jgi:amino acid efflux transporter|nr:amino acid/polyamine/organocation transporter, APC superfamily [Rhizobiales bacterium GAS113]SEC34684.1 amino acid/polyamine/organocation transporter, APC superfamily [Rhizobiales bacterium GAS188]